MLSGDGGNPAGGFAYRKDRGLLGRQSPAIDPGIFDSSEESQAAARANSKRRFRMANGLGVLVEEYADCLRLAVQINVHAGGLTLAVIGHQHVLPLVQRDGRRGLHANPQVRPAPDDV